MTGTMYETSVDTCRGALRAPFTWAMHARTRYPSR